MVMMNLQVLDVGDIKVEHQCDDDDDVKEPETKKPKLNQGRLCSR